MALGVVEFKAERHVLKAVTIYLVVSVCAWALPAWGLKRSKKEQRPEEPPPHVF